MMATPTFKKIFRLTMLLVGLTLLVAADELDETSTASPKAAMMSTTTMTKPNPSTEESNPPFAAVMDIFQAPLAAFKPKIDQKHRDDKTYTLKGRADENSSATTSAPSSIFIKAGSGLESAASSLSDWFNNRMVPQALRPTSSTTPAPQIVHIITNSQPARKPIQIKRQRPVIQDSVEFEDVEEDLNDDSSDTADDDEIYNSNPDLIEDDDQDDYEQLDNRNGFRKTNQYFYIEEETDDNDDFDYELPLPMRNPQRKQQQNIANKRKKNSPNNQQDQKRPMTQRVQIVQNRPAMQTQVKRKRRPSTSFELVPISQNQAMNSIDTDKKKPNNSQNRPVTQFFSIPWSRLGLGGSQKEPDEQQSTPIVVHIPQQNVNRNRRPTKKPVMIAKKPKRKQPVKGQNQGPVFSVLSEDQIRELFNGQGNVKPSKTVPQLANLPVTLSGKRKLSMQDSEERPSDNDNIDDFEPEDMSQDEGSETENEDEEEEDANAYIYVGASNDNNEIDLKRFRHQGSQRGLSRGRASPRLRQSWNFS